jgi:hypothetical protein
VTATTAPSARETVFAALGVASVGLGVAVVVGVAPARILGPVADLNPTQATGVLGVLFVGYALRRRRQNDDQPAPTRLRDVGDSKGPADPGEAVDAALRDVESASTAFGAREQREQVREVVWRTAVRAYAQRYGVSQRDAADAVAAGAWTDDVVAAAFVGDERAPRLPLRERLRGWLHPNRAHRRRAERAASAVHDFAREVTR